MSKRATTATGERAGAMEAATERAPRKTVSGAWTWPRGAVTAFVARHRRGWDTVMAALAVVYVAVAIRNDVQPNGVPPALLLLLSVVFLTEFALRCWDAPSRLAYVRRHWIDAVSCIPLVGGLRAVRLLRLLRLGAAGRLLAGIEREIKSRRHGRDSLWFVAPLLMLLWIGSAYGIWVLEHGRNPALKSFGDAMYWSVVTVTTVGYGDIRPVTPEGRVLAGILVFLGLGLLGFASARLTARWLQQDERAEEATSAAILRQLDLLHAEVVRLHRRLDERDTTSSNGPTPTHDDGTAAETDSDPQTRSSGD